MDEQKEHSIGYMMSERLILRPPIPEDNWQMAAIRSDAEVNRYINRDGYLGLPEAEAFIKKIIHGIANDGWLYWAICLKEDDKLIGTICLWNIDRKTRQAELGYELLPAMQGKGIMSEAMVQVMRVAFEELDFKKIIAVTNRLNRKSVALLERFGFSEADSAVSHDLEPDEAVFVLTRASTKRPAIK